MNKILLVVAIIAASVLACKKSNDQTPISLIEEAKAYFETEVKTNHSGSTSSAGVIKVLLPEKKPDWARANIQHLKFGPTVVVPVSLSNLYASYKAKEKFQVEQNAFLIVYKDEQNKKHAEVVIKIPDENSKAGAFSGITQVTDWQGNLIQSYKYTPDAEIKMNTTVRIQENGATTETETIWCVAVDWISCAQVAGYPAVCQYNYTTYYCFTENSSTPGSGTAPGSGSCCGSYGSISGGNDTYPLAKERQLIKFDTSIKLINVPACVYTTFHTLREQKTGFWGKIIYDALGELPNFKWQMQQALLPSATTAAITNVVNNVPTTTYNTTFLSGATNIALAKTMLHEAVHAFLIYKLPNTQKEYPQLYEDYNQAQSVTAPAQHEEMARSFINDIAYCLKVYGKGLGLQAYDTYYMDMAWGGLMGTSYFNALPPADKERITAINQAEATGKTVVLPNGITVSPLSSKSCNQ